jgi:hypothetical protein
MMLTEAEARDRWCPFARAANFDHDAHLPAGSVPVVINRWGHGNERSRPHGDCMCLASRCMAWRWQGSEDRPERRGYCGLAGKP